LLSWARETFGIKLNVSGSIISVPQPEETKKIVEKVLESLDKWEIAGKKQVLQAASDQL
jgi:ATP synthase F1 complex assembly factor 2